MIPFIFITKDEFKKVIFFKYPLIKYVKMIFWYCLYAAAIYYIYKNPVSYFEDWNFPVAFIFLSSVIIFLSFVIRIILVRLPEELKEDEVIEENFRKNTSVLIPCHNSHDIIEETIKSCLRHYDAENIYIAENENNPEPKESTTKDFAEKYGVNYSYIPRGNKANAMKIVLNDIKTKYVITLDDDTLFPEKFVPKEDYFNEDKRVAGIAFMIRMKDQDSILRQLIDEDYKLYNFFNYTKNYSTIPFIVGIGGIWRTDLFKIATEINPADDIVPYGNDGYEGMILRLNNYKMKQDMQNHVLSYCPDRLYFSIWEILGYGKKISGYGATNLWKQRSLRWFRSSFAKFFINIYLLFTYYSKGKTTFQTIVQNFHYRIVNLYSLFLTVLALFVPFLIYYNIKNYKDYLYLHLGLYIIGVIIMILCRLILFRNRKDLWPRYISIILYPLFTTYIMFLRVFAFVGTLLFYLPFYLNIRFCTCCRYHESRIRKIMEERLENETPGDEQEIEEVIIEVDEAEENVVELVVIEEENPN